MLLHTKDKKFFISSLGIKISDDSYEGNVYRYQDNNYDLAIKKFYELYLRSQNIKYIEYLNILLSKIKTTNILVPKYILYNEKEKFSAIATDYKKDTYRDGNIIDMAMSDFMNNIFRLIKDIDKISEKNILSMDVDTHNIIYDKEIFINDTGAFINVESDSSSFYKKANRRAIYTLIKQIISEQVPFVSKSCSYDEFLDNLTARYEYYARNVDVEDCFLEFVEKDAGNTKYLKDYIIKRSVF